MLSFSFAARCDKGLVRAENQDNFCLDGVSVPAELMQGPTRVAGGPSRSGYLAVFDGMGGEARGDFAALTSAGLAAAMRPELSRCLTGDEIKARVLAFTEQANAAVAKRSREEGRRIGTTMAMLVFRQDAVHVFSVGDSPIFRLSGGKLEKLTQDDTFAQLLVRRGELTPAQAARDPRRNSLTQHIGMIDVTLRLHCSCGLPVCAGDRFLLCSDGLTDMVPMRALSSLLAAAGSAQEAADSLVLAALEAGGRDNVTALTLFVGE